MKTKKRHILFCSEYLSNTGFSCVAENIAKNLVKYFDITVVDYNREHNYILQNDGVHLVGSLEGDDFGVGRVIELMDKVDCLFLINDAWHIDTILEKLKLSDKRIPPIVAYFPIDAEQHCPAWYKHFDIVTVPVTYTDFAKGVVSEMADGFEDKSVKGELMGKLCVVPHGINMGKYHQIQDKNKLRQEFFGTDKYDDSYIVLNANRNQPRKRLDITMLAYSHFAKNYKKKTHLYMHSAISDASVDLLVLAKRYGITDNLILSVNIDSRKSRPVFSEEMMNDLYNVCDVGINTGVGEGWGLTAIEHACTGAPQIIPAHSACKEIFKNVGNFIAPIAPIMLDGIMTLAYLPSVIEATEQIKYLSEESNRKEWSNKCLENFSNPSWDWEFICQKAWLPIMSSAIASTHTE